jgi:hypothetical protein
MTRRLLTFNPNGPSFDPKDKLISLLVDGAEGRKKNLCVILARGAQKLCFIDFRNLESHNCL